MDNKTLMAKAAAGDFVEGVDYWPIGLYSGPDHNLMKNVGVQIAWVRHYKYENEDVFVTAIETISELSNDKEGEEAMLNTLIDSAVYEGGEVELVKAFDNYNQAYTYTRTEYPEVDLKSLVKERFNRE